jgi:anti-anti-sigma factor
MPPDVVRDGPGGWRDPLGQLGFDVERSPMLIRLQAAGDAAVITLTPKSLEDPTAEAVGGLLLRLADQQGRRGLTVDLGELPYLTSMWLAQLVALHRKVRGRGGHLAVVNVPGPVYEVFEVTCLHTVLDVRPQDAA